MNITQGNIFWESDMKIKYNHPYLTEDLECDILVIGGGISGALSAYYQAMQGYNVVIIEKNLIGYNSTLENIGVIIENYDDNVLSKLPSKEYSRISDLKSQALKDLLNILCEINKDDQKVKYKLCDFLKYSDKMTGKFLISKQYEEEANKKIESTLTEDDEIISLQSGIKYKNKAIILNPYIFCQELVQMLSRMENVKVFENTCLDTINSEDNKVEVQTTNRFKITAKKVILATGIDTLKYLKDEEIEIYKTYNVVAKLPNLSEHLPFVAVDNANNNKIIKVSDKNITLSSEDIRIKETELINEKSFSNGKYKKMYNNLLKLLKIDTLKVKNCFYGKYVQTKEHLPVIDEMENMPNVYCNLGVGKNGIIYNAIGAKMLKNIYSDCYTKDMYMFRLGKN